MLSNEPVLPFLVVGAGPTGLTIAAILTRARIPIRVIERKTTLSSRPKASNLMARSQEVLTALDLHHRVAKYGGMMTSIVWSAYGKDFGARTMLQDHCAHEGVLLCGQNNFERELADHLAEEGVPVEFESELVHAEQSAELVIATVKTPSGERTIKCRYLLGCDGHIGPTRKFTRHDFQTTKSGCIMRRMDCRLSWRTPFSFESMWLAYRERKWAAVVPLPGGLHWIALTQPKGDVEEREPTIAEMEAELREIFDDASVTLSSPEAVGCTELSMGIGTGLRDRRIFLVGDSGNPILPNGGQGMNTGIVDAFNLGWKLVEVFSRGARDELLDTYEEERYPIRFNLQKLQAKSLKATTFGPSYWMKIGVRTLFGPFLALGGERIMARAFGQLAEAYPKSPLTRSSKTRGPKPGSRLPNVKLTATEAPRLFDLIYRDRWTIIGFTGRLKVSAREVESAIARVMRPDLPCFIVAGDALSASNLEVIHDLDLAVHRRLAIKTATVLLIRPDGHVAASVDLSATQALEAFCERWIPRYQGPTP